MRGMRAYVDGNSSTASTGNLPRRICKIGCGQCTSWPASDQSEDRLAIGMFQMPRSDAASAGSD